MVGGLYGGRVGQKTKTLPGALKPIAAHCNRCGPGFSSVLFSRVSPSRLQLSYCVRKPERLKETLPFHLSPSYS